MKCNKEEMQYDDENKQELEKKHERGKKLLWLL
jgi:hypothetical protein